MAQDGHVERACDRCRERRVKCDKRHPACLRCEKLGKPCPGYDKKRKFVDEGVNLRKKYLSPGQADNVDNTPQGLENGEPSRFTGRPSRKTSLSSGSPESYKASPAFSTPYLDRQGHRSTPSFDSQANTPARNRDGPIQCDKPASLPASLLSQNSTPFVINSYPVVDTHTGAASVDDTWDNPWFDPQYFDLQPEIYYTQENNSCGFLLEQPSIIDEVDRADFRPSIEIKPEPMLGIETKLKDGNLSGGDTQRHTSQLITDEREHELAFLIRHFTESIGPWMDLFDSNRHFGHFVPIKALRDAMLRNAVAAVAAKQLARVRGSKPFLGSQSQSPARMEVFDDEVDIDWFYKAANYYDKAIAFSRLYLQALSGTLTNPPTPGSLPTLANANTDDLLLAVSIFSMYEYLDNLEMGWMQHLTGMRSLLSFIVPGQEVENPSFSALTVANRASFWNFARADYQAAYINRQQTLLDSEDVILWQRGGLQIASDGTLYADAIMMKSDTCPQRSTIDLVAHTLLYIVLKVVNFVAAEQTQTPATRHFQWNQLIALLDQWNSVLPEPFQPCAQTKHPLVGKNGKAGVDLTELFFSIDVCAATMQLYHFARIVLLLNKPVEQIGDASRLRAYREVAEKAIKHARSVCGIALGRPPPAVRVEMLLPLVVAGSCLEDDCERQLVVHLLRAIEKDTGCVTEPKVRELHKTWGVQGGGAAAQVAVN